ncbi:MAG: hypothetical protein RIM84_05530 [Alphaproteobacteria bacterium]
MIICEPIVWGEEHAPFNAGLVQVGVEASPDTVTFWGEVDHIAALRRIMPPAAAAQVDFAARKPPARVQSANSRVRHDAAHAWRAVRAAADLGERHLIFASAAPGTLIGAKVAGFTLGHRRPATFHVLHSPLTQVWGWRSRNPARRLVDITGALSWPATRDVRLVILEAGIADALATKIPALASQILLLEHPIAETIEAPATRRPGPVRLGFLGMASRAKGFDRYCALATMARQRGATAEFHAIGMAEPGREAQANMADLASKPVSAKLQRAEFIERLRDLDMVVMTHDPAHYTYSPSGVLLDALAAGKPLLSLSNPLVDAIAERHGPIGPTVADLDDAVQLIGDLTPEVLTRPPYTDYRTNLGNAAASRRPAALSAVLARALRDGST